MAERKDRLRDFMESKDRVKRLGDVILEIDDHEKAVKVLADIRNSCIPEILKQKKALKKIETDIDLIKKDIIALELMEKNGFAVIQEDIGRAREHYDGINRSTEQLRAYRARMNEVMGDLEVIYLFLAKQTGLITNDSKDPIVIDFLKANRLLVAPSYGPPESPKGARESDPMAIPIDRRGDVSDAFVGDLSVPIDPNPAKVVSGISPAAARRPSPGRSLPPLPPPDSRVAVPAVNNAEVAPGTETSVGIVEVGAVADTELGVESAVTFEEVGRRQSGMERLWLDTTSKLVRISRRLDNACLKRADPATPAKKCPSEEYIATLTNKKILLEEQLSVCERTKEKLDELSKKIKKMGLLRAKEKRLIPILELNTDGSPISHPEAKQLREEIEQLYYDIREIDEGIVIPADDFDSCPAVGLQSVQLSFSDAGFYEDESKQWIQKREGALQTIQRKLEEKKVALKAHIDSEAARLKNSYGPSGTVVVRAGGTSGENIGKKMKQEIEELTRESEALTNELSYLQIERARLAALGESQVNDKKQTDELLALLEAENDGIQALLTCVAAQDVTAKAPDRRAVLTSQFAFGPTTEPYASETESLTALSQFLEQEKVQQINSGREKMRALDDEAYVAHLLAETTDLEELKDGGIEFGVHRHGAESHNQISLLQFDSDGNRHGETTIYNQDVQPIGKKYWDHGTELSGPRAVVPVAAPEYNYRPVAKEKALLERFVRSLDTKEPGDILRCANIIAPFVASVDIPEASDRFFYHYHTVANEFFSQLILDFHAGPSQDQHTRETEAKIVKNLEMAKYLSALEIEHPKRAVALRELADSMLGRLMVWMDTEELTPPRGEAPAAYRGLLYEKLIAYDTAALPGSDVEKEDKKDLEKRVNTVLGAQFMKTIGVAQFLEHSPPKKIIVHTEAELKAFIAGLRGYKRISEKPSMTDVDAILDNLDIQISLTHLSPAIRPFVEQLICRQAQQDVLREIEHQEQKVHTLDDALMSYSEPYQARVLGYIQEQQKKGLCSVGGSAGAAGIQRFDEMTTAQSQELWVYANQLGLSAAGGEHTSEQKKFLDAAAQACVHEAAAFYALEHGDIPIEGESRKKAAVASLEALFENTILRQYGIDFDVRTTMQRTVNNTEKKLHKSWGSLLTFSQQEDINKHLLKKVNALTDEQLSTIDLLINLHVSAANPSHALGRLRERLTTHKLKNSLRTWHEKKLIKQPVREIRPLSKAELADPFVEKRIQDIVQKVTELDGKTQKILEGISNSAAFLDSRDPVREAFVEELLAAVMIEAEKASYWGIFPPSAKKKKDPSGEVMGYTHPDELIVKKALRRAVVDTVLMRELWAVRDSQVSLPRGARLRSVAFTPPEQNAAGLAEVDNLTAEQLRKIWWDNEIKLVEKEVIVGPFDTTNAAGRMQLRLLSQEIVDNFVRTQASASEQKRVESDIKRVIKTPGRPIHPSVDAYASTPTS